MPKQDFTGVKPSTGGFEQLPEGGYVLVCTGADVPFGKDYCRFTFDVAEGPYKGHESGVSWPLSDIMSFKKSAESMTLHRINTFADSNPGFDAMGAYQTDSWRMFVGKVVGAVVRKRLYTRRDGSDGEGIEIGRWILPDDVRSGNWRPMKPRDQRTGDRDVAEASVAHSMPQQGGTTADLYDEDVPF